MPERLPTWRDGNVELLRPFASTQLIIVDVDGTLVSQNSRESWLRVAALRRALYFGQPPVRLTIATGRTLAGAIGVAGKLGLSDRVPLILYNGSVVCRIRPFALIRHERIAAEAAIHAMELAVSTGATALFYQAAGEISDHLVESVIGVAQAHALAPTNDSNAMPIQWMSPPHLVAKLRDVSPTAILVDNLAAPLIASARIPGVSATSSGSGWVEMRPLGSDKSHAAIDVARFMGVAREFTLALGDGDNDAELLSWAGIGVAVSGATALARDASRYLTNQPVERAAIEVLYLIREARRLLHRSASLPSGSPR